MRLPLGIITASLEAVRARLARDPQYVADAAVIEQTIALLTPPVNSSTARMRKLRAAKKVTLGDGSDAQSDVTCDANVTPKVTRSDAESDVPRAPSQTLPSESPSAKDFQSLAPQKALNESAQTRAHAQHVTRSDAQSDAKSDGRSDAVVTPVKQIASAMDALDGAGMSPMNRATIEALLPKLDLMAAERNTDAVAMISAAWKRFKSDPKTRGNRMVRHEVFLSQLDNWCDYAPAAPPSTAPARRILNAPPKERAQ